MNILLEPEATALLRLPEATLPNLRRLGGGPAFATLRSHTIYRREDLEAWVAQCTTDGTPADEEVCDE